MIPNFILEDHFSQYEQLFSDNGAIKQRIDKDTILHDANTLPHTTYFIKKGIAKFSLVNENGVENILFFLGKGSMYPITRFKESLSIEKYLHMTTVTPMEVLTFPADTISSLLRQCPELGGTIIDHYSLYVNSCLCKILLSTYNDSNIGVSSFLYLYAKNLENTSSLDLTQEQIGQITGVSRVQVTRVLTGLRNSGIIKTSRNRIKIIDIKQLKAYCSNIVFDDSKDSSLSTQEF